MKKLLSILFVLSIIFTGCQKIGVYKDGNKEGKPLDFKNGEVQCVECTMQLETKEHSAQAVLPSGRTYFFDDPGCMALWLQKQKNKKSILVAKITLLDTALDPTDYWEHKGSL